MILSSRHFILLTAMIISLMAISLFKPLLMITALVSGLVLTAVYWLWQHPDFSRMAAKVLAEFMGLVITLTFFMGLLIIAHYIMLP